MVSYFRLLDPGQFGRTNIDQAGRGRTVCVLEVVAGMPVFPSESVQPCQNECTPGCLGGWPRELSEVKLSSIQLHIVTSSGGPCGNNSPWGKRIVQPGMLCSGLSVMACLLDPWGLCTCAANPPLSLIHSVNHVSVYFIAILYIYTD